MNKRVLLFEAMDVINELVSHLSGRCLPSSAQAEAEALLRRYKRTGGTLTYELGLDGDSDSDSGGDGSR